MGRQSRSWSVRGHLKRTVKKILNFNGGRWRLASFLCGASSSARQRLSFNDRLGLRACIEDEECDRLNRSSRALHRTTSCASDEDIDKRAGVFIANFRRQLLLERQISLEPRYCRGNSSGREY